MEEKTTDIKKNNNFGTEACACPLQVGFALLSPKTKKAKTKIQSREMKKALRYGVLFRVWCIPLAVYCQARRRNFPQIKGGTIVSYYTPSGKQVRESAIRRTTRRITQDTAFGGMRTQARGNGEGGVLMIRYELSAWVQLVRMRA